MDSINNNIMQQAAEHVIHANRDGDIHTVFIELNGGHGGADLVIKGFPFNDTHEFQQKFELH